MPRRVGAGRLQSWKIYNKKRSDFSTLYCLAKHHSFTNCTQKARRFGRHYKPTDVNFMKKHLPKGSIITLDHKAHELTKFQTPLSLYVYVDDVENASQLLKNHGFREGKRGNIVLLPKIGSFENPIERVFLDCVANGGRSFLDAAAIMLTHRNMVKTRVRFAGDTILKVQEDLLADEAAH